MALGRTAHAGHRPAVAGLVVALATAVGACAASPQRAAVDDTPRATAERGTGTEPTAEAPTTTRPLPTTTTTSSTTTAPGPALPAGDDATVARIVDGDTLRAVVGGAEVAVRLIGIDTPEVRQDDCYADEATAHLTALVPPGAAIRLAYDVERHDRYGRTLAYVFRPGDGLHVNVAMARDGFAQQLTIPPNVAHADAVSAAVDEARAAGRGLWGGACAPAAPEATTPATPAPAPSGAPAATRRTRRCASRRRRPTSTARTSGRAASRSCRPTPTGSTATATASAAKGDPGDGSPLTSSSLEVVRSAA